MVSISVYAQTICEELSSILTTENEDLLFVQVPGAVCETEGRDEFQCFWPKTPPPPRPSDDGYWPGLKEWILATIVPDMQKLGREIQNCIKQNALPFDWGQFKTDKPGRLIRGYYVQTKKTNKNCEDSLLKLQCKRNRLKTIKICYEYDDDVVGAGILLEIDFSKRGASYCGW